jgi:hypothetical protein
LILAGLAVVQVIEEKIQLRQLVRDDLCLVHQIQDRIEILLSAGFFERQT